MPVRTAHGDFVIFVVDIRIFQAYPTRKSLLFCIYVNPGLFFFPLGDGTPPGVFQKKNFSSLGQSSNLSFVIDKSLAFFFFFLSVSTTFITMSSNTDFTTLGCFQALLFLQTKTEKVDETFCLLAFSFKTTLCNGFFDFVSRVFF